MLKIYLYILLFFSLASIADNGIAFKENKNQWPGNVLFGADYKSTRFFVNTNGFNFCVYDGNDLHKAHHAKHHKNNSEEGITPATQSIVKGHNYSVIFNNASFLNIHKTKPLTEYYNYFIGNDESKWTGNVKAYDELLFSDIYTNIDLKLYSNSTNIKYDIIVKPNGNSNQVELNYKSVNSVLIKNGNLVIETSIGNVIEQKPYAYQFIKGKKIEVLCRYKLKDNNTVIYDLPNGYNKNYDLIIDPTIIVCSYDNSTVWANCYGATHDAIGNIFVLGIANAGYPITPGAFQTTADSIFDDIVTKYNPNGSSKIFTTYLGGDNYEAIQNAIVTNTSITLFGTTYSTNFPVTTNAYDTSFNDTTSQSDLYISKLDLTGSSLIASTYIGGSNADGINNTTVSLELGHIGNMVMDSLGYMYICTSTNSDDFPVTAGTFQTTKHPGVDNIAFKIDPSLSSLVYSTFFGGSNVENAYHSVLTNNDELIISGTTQSNDFPTTTGAINTVKNPGRDMYVLHFNNMGTNIIASTFLGTNANDYGYLIDTDINNDIYVLGYIGNPTTFTSTAGIYNISNARCVIHKLNSTLSSVIYKTKFGSTNFYEYSAFKIDSCQNIYIAGFVSGINFPVTADKFQNHGGGDDLYITVFNTNMLSMKFGTYFGGPSNEHRDGGLSAFTKTGMLYQGICINKGGLPTTVGAFQPTFPTLDSSEYNDAFVKIDLQSFVKTNSSYGTEVKACAPFTANFNSFTNIGTNSWDFGDGSPISFQQNTSHTYNNVGNYTVLLVANDSTTCNKTDTVKSLITILNPSELKISGNNIICENQSAILKAESNDAVSYSWSTGAITSTISVQIDGTYTATINNGGCDTKQTIDVKHAQINTIGQFPNVVTPNNDHVNDVIDLNKYDFTQVIFTVFDRWGIETYQTDNIEAIFNPSGYTDGTYFYTLDYQTACDDSQIKTKGFITIIK